MVTAQIGLMYPSDYGFAAAPSAWTSNLIRYDLSAKNKDWLLLGSTEWLLSPNSLDSDYAWYVGSSGNVDSYKYVTYTNAVRPSFYLLPSVSFVGGDGTASSPIRVN